METEHEYHVRRAREELDLAYRSERRAVSTAHLRLSALHMAELRALATRATPSPGSISSTSKFQPEFCSSKPGQDEEAEFVPNLSGSPVSSTILDLRASAFRNWRITPRRSGMQKATMAETG